MEVTGVPREVAGGVVRAGQWLVGIAALHAAFGVWFGRAALLAIARDGFWNTVDGEASRSLVFWFLVMSPWVAMLGQLLIRIGRAGRVSPRALGWELLLLALVCGVVMPASGFWLGIVPAALLLRGSARPCRPLRPERPPEALASTASCPPGSSPKSTPSA